MKFKIVSILALILFLSFPALAQGNSGLTVEDIRICTSIEDRKPVGVDTSFPGDVGHLYCFTRLSSDRDYATLYHVWYYNDREMLKVELNTKAKTWRTWSTKQIPASWAGDWRVDVLSSEGSLLGSIRFIVKE